MKIIGLTGSIGMGKSVTASMLQRMGYPVFDSDLAVHKLLAPYGAAFQTVALSFPECWDAKKHLIDRQKLGRIVFADSSKRKELEDILHPLVWWQQKKFIQESIARGAKIAVLDIPLLFETGSQRKCDAVICVDSPHFIQRQRVLSRPNMNEDHFYAILSRQMPQFEKKKLSDYILQTGLGYAHTLRHLKKIIANLTKDINRP
ncbi:MAG: dephospho-CoA kinase [Alphaproteobacteria bacterium CG1_02_46_17]|nr:MAG: dephospho-CoA kinase [Alphaproteobacteria bacterium CG1_02_46_17]